MEDYTNEELIEGVQAEINYFNRMNHNVDVFKEMLTRFTELNKKQFDSHPDNEADGIVFCGKCGKIK